MRRILIVIATVIVLITTFPHRAHSVANYSNEETRDGQGNKSVRTEAHDKQRVPGYSGPVSNSPRQSKQCTPDPNGLCPVPIQGSPCLYEHDVLGMSYPDIQERVDRENANRKPDDFVIVVVCGDLVPYFQERTVPYNPQDEVNAIAWVKDYFSNTALPVPKPELSAKNGGICGVVHTADLHMPVEVMHEEQQTPFGQLELHIYGKIEMDWGDGHKDSYTTAGGPYPSAIAHSWTTRGNYIITAQVDWTANYTLGPYNGYTYNGTLSGISTSGNIPTFQVLEAQAMLTD